LPSPSSRSALRRRGGDDHEQAGEQRRDDDPSTGGPFVAGAPVGACADGQRGEFERDVGRPGQQPVAVGAEGQADLRALAR